MVNDCLVIFVNRSKTNNISILNAVIDKITDVVTKFVLSYSFTLMNKAK